ncbi:MAG: Gfo/Idh/MocA family oxidoreductase [Planctomycetes bacterium]|nr:Gfo/Idh/MocA family oxidoreductase [Planctomycetota bacterium]
MNLEDLDRRDFVKMGAGMISVLSLSPSASAMFKPVESDQPLLVAMIGVGRQGRLILGELEKFGFVKVAALCDTDERRLKSAQRRAPEARIYDDARALLDGEKEVQAVFLATPTHQHREIAVAALEAGRHLYCEAPLATTLEDAKAIAAAAAQAKALFHGGLQLRANPIYQLARSFVRSGAIRDVVALRGQYHRKGSERVPADDPAREKALNWALYRESSIGLPGEKGIHSFDTVNWFLGKRPVAVAGWGEIMLHRDGRDIPDTVHCVLSYPDQVKMIYDATLANSFEGSYQLFLGTMGAVKVIGNLGWLFKEADAPTQGWEVYAVRQQFHKEEGITLIANATKLARQGKLKEGVGLPYPELYYGIEDFLAGIVEKKTETACPPLAALEAAVVAIKTHEAVVQGKEIALQDEWFNIG